MKNSKKYAAEIRKLYRSLKIKGPKVKKVVYAEPADALVYALVSENMTQTEAQTAVRRLSRHFVDWNDLRVSRMEEVLDVIGRDNPVIRATAEALTAALQYIFSRYSTVSLQSLTETGKRPAKQALEKIDGISRFAVNYVMLTSLAAHAIPLTGKMIEYLHANELVHPAADEHDIEGFLQRQIPASQAYEFYFLLRRACEKRLAVRKKKKSTSPKTKKGTKGKTNAKTKHKKPKKSGNSV